MALTISNIDLDDDPPWPPSLTRIRTAPISACTPVVASPIGINHRHGRAEQKCSYCDREATSSSAGRQSGTAQAYQSESNHYSPTLRFCSFLRSCISCTCSVHDEEKPSADSSERRRHVCTQKPNSHGYKSAWRSLAFLLPSGGLQKSFYSSGSTTPGSSTSNKVQHFSGAIPSPRQVSCTAYYNYNGNLASPRTPSARCRSKPSFTLLQIPPHLVQENTKAPQCTDHRHVEDEPTSPQVTCVGKVRRQTQCKKLLHTDAFDPAIITLRTKCSQRGDQAIKKKSASRSNDIHMAANSQSTDDKQGD